MTTRPVGPRTEAVMVADLYSDLLYPEPTQPRGWRAYLPGLTIVTLGTLAAGFLSDRYGAPLTLMALLIGLALNFLSADERLHPGLAFSSRALLRCGIVLVGVRVTADRARARFTDLQAGFLLGASIHDVAQALGAGYAFSPATGQIAAIVKLTRVALLAPVLAIVAATLPRCHAATLPRCHAASADAAWAFPGSWSASLRWRR